MTTETVPCTICKTPTRMTGTKLCDRCWEMDRAFRSLASSSRESAYVWLTNRLKEFQPGVANHIKVEVQLEQKA